MPFMCKLHSAAVPNVTENYIFGRDRQNTCNHKAEHCSRVLLPTGTRAASFTRTAKKGKRNQNFTRHRHAIVHLRCIYLHKGTLHGSPAPARSSQTEAWSRRSWSARLQRGQAAGFLARPPHAAKCRMSCSRPRRTPSTSHGEASAAHTSPAPAPPAAKMRSRMAMASLSCRYTCCDARSLSHLFFLCEKKKIG
jgi:hypothetical protein